ncbi:hypothetical protein AK812_SmicGene20453 [Symbiodinium microadriaticum]|uniref:Uncharacterized protein n=1 Tax=Symbiodinium microadriaticum TaxID=2951 RepID=A0A1Q9DPW4_SYMMI|nr:hypothetical protein AK812_SmicGene20453 [Symbiodinium microadriaticum]
MQLACCKSRDIAFKRKQQAVAGGEITAGIAAKDRNMAIREANSAWKAFEWPFRLHVAFLCPEITHSVGTYI